VFIVELRTRTGKVAEGYATYEEARRRVEQYPAEDLVGLPLIFQQLADGSERVVRDDGKPLQFHRVLAEDMPAGDDEPVPLSDDTLGLVGADGQLKMVQPHPPEDEEEWGEDIPWP